MDKALQMKVDKLQFLLKSYGGVAVAFSAGVDSTVLLKAAKETLGTEQVMALTVQSSLMPASDVEDAVTFCREEGIRHEVVQVDPLIYYDVRTNPPQRCYYCKRLIFGKLREIVGQKGIVHLLDGSNVDDGQDYRPGRQALRELGVLTSRIPYGEVLSREKLQRIEQAEKFLHAEGFTQLRVRSHADMARLELLPEDIERFMADGTYQKAVAKLKEFGFAYVTLDLEGYRMGSMNEVLKG